MASGCHEFDEARFQAIDGHLRKCGENDRNSRSFRFENTNETFDTEDGDIEDGRSGSGLHDFTSFDERKLKCQFLDRTAELFANTKGGKHVTADFLVEWPDKAHLIIAKNGGPNREDLAFAKDLRNAMDAIGKSEASNTDGVCRKLWQSIIVYYRPRIRLLSQEIQELNMKSELTPAVQAMQDSARRPAADDEFLVSFANIIDLTAQTHNYSLTNRYARLVLEAHKMRKTWPSVTDSSYDAQVISKLKVVIFSLARVRTSYNVIIKAALQLPNLSRFRVIVVDESKLHPQLKGQDRPGSRAPATWSLSQLFETFGVCLDESRVRKMLSKSVTLSEVKRKFDINQRQEANIHAEMQLLLYLVLHQFQGSSTFDYLGCSKRCCFLCWSISSSQNIFSTRGSHGKLYDRWGLPWNTLEREEFINLKASVLQVEEKMIQILFKATPATIKHAPESTVGSSTILSMPYHLLDKASSAGYIARKMSKAKLRRHIGDVESPTIAEAGVYIDRKGDCEDHIHSVLAEPSLEADDSANLSRSAIKARKGLCSNCERQTSRRCNQCDRDWFCSMRCETKRSLSHRFLCAGGSLTTADYLFDAIGRDEIPDDPQTLEDYLIDRCETWNEKSHLLGLYKGLYLLEIDPMEVDEWRREGKLVSKIIQVFEELPEQSRGKYFPWFMANKERLLDSESAPEPELSRWMTEVRDLLDPDDQDKRHTCLEPRAKRLGVMFLAICSQAAHPPPGSVIEGIDLWYELGFCACDGPQSEGRLGGLYNSLLFGDKFRRDYAQSLGTEYCNWPSPTRCSFKKFWTAWETGDLAKLIQNSGLGMNGRDAIDIKMFLSYPMGSQRPAVWKLKYFLAEEDSHSPDSLIAARTYGFHEDLDPRQTILLKDLYSRVLSLGSAMGLQAALDAGHMLKYVSTYICDIDQDIATLLDQLSYS